MVDLQYAMQICEEAFAAGAECFLLHGVDGLAVPCPYISNEISNYHLDVEQLCIRKLWTDAEECGFYEAMVEQELYELKKLPWKPQKATDDIQDSF